MDYIVKQAKILGERVTQLETENKRLKAAVELLLVEKEQWIKSREQWTHIMQQTITASNDKTSKVSDEIDKLKSENIKLRRQLAGVVEG